MLNIQRSKGINPSSSKEKKSIERDITIIQLLELSEKNFKTSCCKYVQGHKDGYNERTYGDTQQRKWKLKTKTKTKEPIENLELKNHKSERKYS